MRICGNPQWSEEWDKLGLRRSEYEESHLNVMAQVWNLWHNGDIIPLHPLHTNYHTDTTSTRLQGSQEKWMRTFYYNALIVAKCLFLTVSKGWVTIGTGARPGQLFIVRLNCVDNKLLPNIIYHTNSILPPNSTHLKCMQWHWQYSSFSIFVLLLTNIFLLIILGRHKNRQTRV